MRNWKVNKAKRGFTIIEILIAIVILTVGILGILAIFPKAIESATKTIEDTYSGIIAQSVMDSVKVGIKETKVAKAATENYFLLNHDGVTTSFDDPDLGDITNIQKPQDHDSIILMPASSNNTAKKFFIYPKTLDKGLNSNGYTSDQNILESDPLYIQRIYSFGDRAGPNTQITGASYLHDLATGKTGTPAEQRLARKDPYLSYGFCLVVGRSSVDGTTLSNDLYMIDVYVFRNFLNVKNDKRNKPLRKLSSLVAF